MLKKKNPKKPHTNQQCFHSPPPVGEQNPPNSDSAPNLVTDFLHNDATQQASTNFQVCRTGLMRTLLKGMQAFDVSVVL